MINDSFGWLFRPGIGRRIAVTMVLSLMAVQAQAFLQVVLLTDPQIRLVGTRWLAETTAQAAKLVFTAAPEQRNAALAKLADDKLAKFEWRRERPEQPATDDSRLISGRLAATIRSLLGDDARQVSIASVSPRYRVPSEATRITFDARSLAGELGTRPVEAGEPESLIPATLTVAVQGPDGSWLTVSPIAYSGDPLPVGPLIGAGVIIALVSVLLARRIVAPLDRLVDAANRIGTARELVPVRAEGMHEFAAVATAFEDMQRKLLRFVDDRTKMLAAISHDLRSALTRMRLNLELVAETGDRSALEADIEEMRSMVDSSLAFATGEARLAPNQPLDLAALLISIVDETADAGNICTYSGPDHVETIGHPVSLKRAFRNVIDNGVKYGGEARVTLETAAHMVRIVVVDRGPGIPADAFEEVFRPFLRLDSARSHQVPGTGLGLTIARDVIQSHGGSITLGNAPTGGLCVTIELPSHQRRQHQGGPVGGDNP